MNVTDTTSGFLPAGVLARAELLDHARHPRNRGELADADIVQEEANLLCGDVVTVYALLLLTSEVSKNNFGSWVARMTFTGSGCIISQAAASMLTEYVVGKSIADIQIMGRKDVETLLGATFSPSRVKCAMLPLIALKNGLIRHAHHS